jgi:uncharacterized membrane protein HdeD (DUF308 family)
MQGVAARRAERLGTPWWAILIQGITSVIIGLFLLTAPGTTTLVLVRVLGYYWLISGILSIVRIFTKERDVHWGWLLAWGILGIVAGLVVLDHPLWSAVLIPMTLVIFMGVNGVFMGIIALIEAFSGKGGWAAGILGVLSILFGVVLLTSPLVATTVLPIIVGAFALVGGIVSIVLSFRLCKTQ